VDPYTTHVTIDAPREAVFTFLADVANLPVFLPIVSEPRLLREDPVGVGAGLRFKIAGAKFNRFPWADLSWVEVEHPRRLVGAGRMGKYNRVRVLYELSLEPAGGSTTRVAATVRTQPRYPTDRLVEAVGTARRLRRGWAKGLRRLKTIFEEDGRGAGPRATIAGGPRKPATGTPLHPLARR
jgi:uncharacterized protein YndB with AHSA1/START domain